MMGAPGPYNGKPGHRDQSVINTFGPGVDWVKFYTELYTRLELEEYLPKVLMELTIREALRRAEAHRDDDQGGVS